MGTAGGGGDCSSSWFLRLSSCSTKPASSQSNLTTKIKESRQLCMQLSALMGQTASHCANLVPRGFLAQRSYSKVSRCTKTYSSNLACTESKHACMHSFGHHKRMVAQERNHGQQGTHNWNVLLGGQQSGQVRHRRSGGHWSNRRSRDGHRYRRGRRLLHRHTTRHFSSPVSPYCHILMCLSVLIPNSKRCSGHILRGCFNAPGPVAWKKRPTILTSLNQSR